MKWETVKKARSRSPNPSIRLGVNNSFLNKAFCVANGLVKTGDKITYDLVYSNDKDGQFFGLKIFDEGKSVAKLTSSNQVSIYLKTYFASKGFEVTENFTVTMKKRRLKGGIVVWCFQLDPNKIRSISMDEHKKASELVDKKRNKN